jgi:branched-chain amino acid transport system permease protein
VTHTGREASYIDVVYLVQTLISGLANGAIYGLVALGFVLLVNAVNILNFAQGEFVMLGAFLVYTFGVVLHLPFAAAFILVVGAAALIGIVFERIAYRPIRQGDNATFLVATIAASVLIRNVAQNIWGTVPFAYNEPFGRSVLKFGDLQVLPQHLFIFGFTLLLVGLLWFFFFKTRLGKLMRATAQDRQTARLLGIRVARIGTITFMMAAAIGALAGVLVAPIYFVNLDMGFSIGLKAFVASIIGGWGSVPGAIVGGVLLGLVEQLATAYISSAYKDAFAFLVLIFFLIFLPRGVFGEKVADKA